MNLLVLYLICERSNTMHDLWPSISLYPSPLQAVWMQVESFLIYLKRLHKQKVFFLLSTQGSNVLFICICVLG